MTINNEGGFSMKPNDVTAAGQRLLGALNDPDSEEAEQVGMVAAVELFLGLCVNIAAIRAKMDKPARPVRTVSEILHEQRIAAHMRRWEEFTQREAILESTGQTFAEVKVERIGE